MLLHHCECVGLDAACVKTVHETFRAVSVGKRKLNKSNCVIMLLHHCECVGLDAACVKTVHKTLRAVSVGKRKLRN